MTAFHAEILNAFDWQYWQYWLAILETLLALCPFV